MNHIATKIKIYFFQTQKNSFILKNFFNLNLNIQHRGESFHNAARVGHRHKQGSAFINVNRG